MKRCVAILVGAVLATCVGAGSAAAAFPGGNGKIVFTRASGPFGNCGLCVAQIYAVKPDGSQVKRLTHSPRNKRFPSFSADGRRIVFAQQRDDGNFSHIAVMDADGGHLRQLTNAQADDTTPQFRPDGSKIVFSRFRRGSGYGVYVMGADGSHLRRLTHDGYGPTYSPNGRRIAFQSTESGYRGIFVIDATGRHRHPVTYDPIQVDENGSYRYLDYTPDYSPDGRRIVFVRMGHGGCALGDDRGNVTVVDADGGHVSQITDDGLCGAYSDPQFSPNGRQIVGITQGAVVVMRADGTHRRFVRKSNDGYAGVAWQPRPKHR